MRGVAKRAAWVALAVALALAAGRMPQSRAQNETSTALVAANNNNNNNNNGTDANPFSQDDDGAKICCCQLSNTSSYSAFEYQDPSTAPSECCCGAPGVDCPDSCASSSFSSVCGSGQVCGILLLMAALVGTLAITICITGVFLARRRRQRHNTDQFLMSLSQSGRASVQQVNIVRIPDEQLKDLEIKDIDIEENLGSADPHGRVDEEQGGVRQAECPICLEPVEHQVVSEFPCGHTCCRGCRDDLVHHSSRIVNASTVAILCPLCRKLAVAPSPAGASRRSRQQVVLVQSVVDERRVEAEATEEALTRSDDGDGASATRDADEANPTTLEDNGQHQQTVPRSP